jgi:hypothetical protein
MRDRPAFSRELAMRPKSLIDYETQACQVLQVWASTICSTVRKP